MRKFIFSFILIILFIGFVHPSDINPPKKGYFKNSNGEKCWYKTTFNNNKYFSVFEQRICIHNFETDTSMINDEVSKRLIANVITRFYVNTIFQKDTKFKTDIKYWKKAEGSQKTGFCIESSNYSIPKVWLDFEYSKDKKYIVKILHTDGF